MQTAKFVKRAITFALCFVLAFMVSRYGMPLYSVTNWIIEHSYQFFSQYQDDIYEAGTDPVTFTTLLVVVTSYAFIIYYVLHLIFKALGKRR